MVSFLVFWLTGSSSRTPAPVRTDDIEVARFNTRVNHVIVSDTLFAVNNIKRINVFEAFVFEPELKRLERRDQEGRRSTWASGASSQ
jgi:hypothetical protein